MDSQRMTIILLDGEKEEFQYYALENDNENQELIEGVTYPLKNTFTEEVMRTGKPILASDIKNIEEGRYWIREKLLKEGIHSFIVFPLEYQGKIFGTMSLGSRMAGSFSERHLDILRQIAPGLAISIQNILLLNEIKGSEERYRTVVEGALDGVLVVGEDYRFQYVNERLAEMLGYPREELIGSDFRNYLGEESRQMVEDRYARRQRGEKISPQYEFQVIRKDGELRNVEISSSIVRNAQGNISTIAFLKDVTEKKKMEEQLFQNEKLRALGEMASGVAHDFNNALAAILGNAQLLLYAAQDEETREALKTIEKVAKDSAQTVKRLQDFTRRRVEQKF
jgi:PAS domain S-box-containing protein